MADKSGELRALLQQGYRYALALTHNPSQAEDLVQDAWLRLIAGEAVGIGQVATDARELAESRVGLREQQGEFGGVLDLRRQGSRDEGPVTRGGAA